MKLIFVGLGKMGGQLVTRMVAAGHSVIAVDPDQAAVETAQKIGAKIFATHTDALREYGAEPPIVWLMIPADVVEAEFASWLTVLPAGSLIIDGGNSNYQKSMRRAAAAKDKNIRFMDIGTSGGVLGQRDGFSLMVGGERSDFDLLKPLFQILCDPNGSFMYTGPAGSGHYVKMVHNGIEYGVMQAYAEGYHLLKEGKDFPSINIAGVSQVWQHGSIIASRLNELTHQILQKNPHLDGINGHVQATGEADWAVETAHRQHIPMPALEAAIHVRHQSRSGKTSYATKLLAAMRNAFGGHSINQ